MATTQPHPFPPPVQVLLERRLPERATPAGYSALIAAYDLAVPPPRTLHATGAHHRIAEADGWRILTPRHAPRSTLAAHLTFALKHEGLELAVLKRLFLALGAEPSETAFLRNYDVFRASVEELVDMPERTIDLLYRLLRQHGGKLSRRARTMELAALTDHEVQHRGDLRGSLRRCRRLRLAS